MQLRYYLIAMIGGAVTLATAQTLRPQVNLQQPLTTTVDAQALRQGCSQFSSSTPLVLPKASGVTVDPRITDALRAGGVPTGNGPLLDVFNHSPAGRAPRGSELVLSGRDFPLGKVAARIGSTQLESLGNSSSEARFQIPANVSLENQPLVVWQEGGTPRTLAERYSVFDPTIRIYGIVPARFAKGERVLLCGRGLNNVWQATPSSNVETSRMLRIGDLYIEILNVEVGASGAEMRFLVGGTQVYRRWMRPIAPGSDGREGYYGPPENPVTRISGRIGLTSRSLQLSSSDYHQTDVYSPGEAQWDRNAPLRVQNVYSSTAVGRGPFMLLSSSVPIRNQLVVDGTGLDEASFTLGNRPLSSANGPGLGIQAVFNVPRDASTGELCARAGGATRCFPTPIRIAREPEFVQAPTTAAAGAEVMITGIALTPDPSLNGLSYRLTFSRPAACATEMDVLEHTSSRIRIRLRYTGTRTPAAECARNPVSGQSEPQYGTLQLLGSYEGAEAPLASTRLQVTFPP